MQYNRKIKSLNREFNNFKLNIVEHGLLESDKSWFHSDIVSSYNRLYFIIEGNPYISRDGESFLMKAGTMYLIPAGTMYTYACSSEVHKFYLHFELPVLPGLDVFSGVENFLELPFSIDLLSEIIACAKEGTVIDMIKLNCILFDIILRFAELGKISENEKVLGFYRHSKLLSFIEENLSANLKIQDIADALDIPYHKISKDFKTDTGEGLKNYIEKMLLQKSKELLLCTDMNISEIANELNFCDAYYFSRFFSKFEKVSPKDYKNFHLKF
ncbi:MAG: AraC family transcriptional regulator [Clostridia bacterium]